MPSTSSAASVDDVWLAGDAVLQYRFSNEVIESVRDHGITYVVGNHELTLLSQDGERARSAPDVRRHNLDFMAEAPNAARDADLGQAAAHGARQPVRAV